MPSLVFLGGFYFLSLGALAALIPFLSARLEAAGVGGVTIGVLLAMLPLGRLLSAPLWGWLADRFQAAGVLLRLGCGLSLVGGGLLFAARTPAAAAVGLFAFAAGRTPMGPLVDTFVLRALAEPGRDPRDYGRVRVWGSVGFLAIAVVAGRLGDAGVDPAWLGTTLLATCFVASFGFPGRGSGGPAPVWPALVALAREPFLAPLLAMSALQAMTLSVYDTFFSAHVHALGLPAMVTSYAVAVGVACEVAVMHFGRPILARLGLNRALLLAALAAVPRWWLTARLTDPTMLVLVQMLHGLSFGVFWIAGVQRMATRTPAQVAASAQSLFAAASYGVGALAGALLAGEVRAAHGTGAIFEVMTVVALGASVCAAWLVRRDTVVVVSRSP